jgi:hypothetical protein
MKAIITYKYKSSGGVCGSTIGADGSGEYGYILDGEFEKLYEKIKELYDTVLNKRGVSDVVCIINEERYSGFPITEIKV